MAGVAGPMLRYDRGGAVRFLCGLALGGVLAGLLLAVPIFLVGTALQAAPSQVRLWLVAAVCAGFAVADLLGRTPHVWRQVPQFLVHRLQPGSLGVVWGFDLGLLFTTQKVVSLIWVTLAAIVLLEPASAGVVLTAMAFLATFAVAAWTVRAVPPTAASGRWEGQWLKRTRQVSGLLLLTLSVLTSVQAWQA